MPTAPRTVTARTSGPARRRPAASVVAILVAGGLVTISAFAVLRGFEIQVEQAEFQRRATELAAAVGREIDHNVEALEATRGLMIGAPHVGRAGFDRFAANLAADHPSIRTVGWAPIVRPTERAEMEAQARRHGYPNFRIQDARSDGLAPTFVPAASSAAFFPLLHSWQAGGAATAVGLDLGADPAILVTLAQAREAGQLAVAAGAVQWWLGGAPGTRLAVLPVYEPGADGTTPQGRSQVRGFVTMTFSLEKIVSDALATTAMAGVGLHLYGARLPAALPASSVGYLYPEADEDSRAEAVAEETAARRDGRYFVTRRRTGTWRLTGFWYPRSDYPFAVRRWLAVGAIPIGAMLAGLLAAYRWAVLRRRAQRDAFVTELAQANTKLRREIQTRSRVEESLRESEAEARAIVEAAGEAFVESDAAGRVRAWNPKAEQVFGWPAADVIGQRMADLIVPARFRAAHDAGLVMAAETGAGPILGVRVEQVAIRRDGREFPIELSVSRVERGRSWSFAAFIVDISDRKQAEERLRASEERYSLIVQATDEGIWDQDLQTGQIYFSPRQRKLMEDANGAPMDELDWASRVHPDDLAGIRSARAAYLDRRRTTYEVEYRSAPDPVTDACQWFASRGVAVWDEQGRPVRFLGATRDITERKRAEARLRETEAELRQSQRLEALGKLAGGVAHDFNNLLTVIAGHAELLASAPSEEARVRHETGIADAIEHASVLVRQLLAFGHAHPLKPVTTDVNELLASCGGLLRPLLGDPIQLATELAAPAAYTLIDRAQLEQVIMNLAINARDAMPEGGSLRLSTGIATEVPGDVGATPADWRGDYVHLSVHDTGTGMDLATVERAFDPFFTTKNQGEGSGLGLSTVHGIVTQTGGQVRIESTPGVGSTIHVYLPRTNPPAESPAAHPDVDPAPPAARTILLVEDDAYVREVATAAIEAGGYAVTAVAHGPAAVQLAGACPQGFDLIISDVIMPHMSGLDLASELRRQGVTAPMLFVSGDPSIGAKIEESCLDGAYFLSKPFASATLLAKLREVLAADAERAPVVADDADDGSRRTGTDGSDTLLPIVVESD